MKITTYKGKNFLQYAKEAIVNIRKASKLTCGNEVPESGSFLGNANDSIYIIMEMYLSYIIGKEIESDELNDLTTKIIYANEDELNEIMNDIFEIFEFL